MTDRYESRVSTHADDCWSWGPAHYECAAGKIERMRAEIERLRAERDALAALAQQPVAPSDAAAMAHEIWAAAQLAPGEGIVDGVARVEALLRGALAALKAENEMLRESLKDADNELDWLDEEMDTCDHSVGVCTCSYWSMRRKMKATLFPAGPASQRGSVDIALLVLVISIVGFLVAVGVGWYSDSQRPTIELKKDDWECVKSEQRTSLQPMLVGKTTTLLPMTSTVCVQYNRRAD